MAGQIIKRPRKVSPTRFMEAFASVLWTDNIIDRVILAYRERDNAELGRIIAERIEQILEGE